MKATVATVALALSLVPTVISIEVDFASESSVNNALSSIAYDMMSYYQGNETGEVPGLLPGPCQGAENCYYWWMAGGMWAALIDYYKYTGDSSYQQTVLQSLAFQIGPDQDYAPPNQTKNLGIDDQAFWAFAALEAAEAGVPNSQADDVPAWITLAENVFNFQTPLWDTETCDGGFRWQIFSFNAGYNLKNTASNGAFFQLAARLARYTDNSTYADWAEKVYNWTMQSPLYEKKDDVVYIYDNTDTDNGCIDAQSYVWTANYGHLLVGSAMMYNYTNGSDVWRTRVNEFVDSALALFFTNDTNDTMSEITCEGTGNCNNDQSSYKAYLSRWMAVTSVVAPFTAEKIAPKLASSAMGAAAQCSGGENGRMCGREWYSSTWDGSSGVGQQMSALAVIGATKMNPSLAPLKASSPNAQQPGQNSTTNNNNPGSGSGSGGSGGPNGAARLSGTRDFFMLLTTTIMGTMAWFVL